MAACELCWSAAYMVSRLRGIHQAEAYHELLVENETAHTHGAAASSVDGGQD